MLSFAFIGLKTFDAMTFCGRGEQSEGEEENEEEEERGQSDQNRRREQVNFTQYWTIKCHNTGK